MASNLSYFFCLSSIIVYVNCSNRKYKGHIYIHIIYTRHIIKSTTLIIISTLNKISTKIIITSTYTIKKIVWYGQKLFFMGVLNNYDWNRLGVGARSKPVSTQHSVRQDINYNINIRNHQTIIFKGWINKINRLFTRLMILS